MHSTNLRCIAALWAVMILATTSYAEDPRIAAARIKVLDVAKTHFSGEGEEVSVYVSRAGQRIVTDIKVSGCELSGAKAMALFSASDITALHLQDVEVAPDAWREITAIKGIESLKLFHLEISELGVEKLIAMNRLRSLTLCQTELTEKGWAALGGLKQVQELTIEQEVPESGWQSLMKLNLRILDVSKLANGDLKGLSSQKQLRELRLWFVENLTARGLDELAELKDLRLLNLQKTGVDELIFQITAKLQNLTSLQLSNMEITDQSVADIGKLQNLADLELWNCELSNRVVSKIATLPKLRHLNLRNSNVNDDTLRLLERMSGLRSLYLFDTGVSEDGLQRLRNILPKCKILEKL